MVVAVTMAVVVTMLTGITTLIVHMRVMRKVAGDRKMKTRAVTKHYALKVKLCIYVTF